MFHSNRSTSTSRASAATALCAALVTTGAMASPPVLRTIAVTPTAATIEVRLRKLHLVRPDLMAYPLSIEVYC